MIPPADERSVRPCITCTQYYEDDGCIPTCNLDRPEFYVRNENTVFDEVIHKIIDRPLKPDEPCKYHLTNDEYRELIDSGGV